MATITTVRTPSRTDPRLGRHQVHDERSRAYALAPLALPTKEVLHERHIPILDQGQLGSCTAHAQLGMLSSGPLNLGKPFVEADAVQLYEDETVVDDAMGIPGQYPPEDTGSCGLAACKVSQQRGWISVYRHAFSARTALGWLGRQPISIGIPWYQSMFTPDTHGVVKVDRRSGVAGGHQVCVDGIEPRHSLVRFANSWGPGWGDSGWGWLSYANLSYLLGKGGDAVTVTLA